MNWLARHLGSLVVEITLDGTLSTYYRLLDKDYEVPYLLNEEVVYPI